MKELKLKIHPNKGLNLKIVADNTELHLKKGKSNTLETSYNTNKEFVTLFVYNILEINSKLWFLMSLFYFIISIFGILDVPHKKCIQINSKFIISLKEENNNVELYFNETKNNKALNIKTDLQFDEINNNYYIDTKAKKRLKIMRLVKFSLWILLIIVSICLIVK